MYRYLERLQKSRLSRFTFRAIAFSIFLFSLSSLALRGLSTLFENNPVWVNKFLGGYKATASSPSVRWRYLDPIIETETFVFGAGSIQKLKLELDLIESILRANPVPKKVEWEKLSLDFIYAEKSGWQIKNFQSLRLPFNLTKSLRNADSLEGYVELSFIDENVLVDVIGIDIRSVNFGSEHLNSISIRNIEQERGGLKFESYEKIMPLGLSEDFFSVSGSISLPDKITKGPNVNFSVDDWWLSNRSGKTKALFAGRGTMTSPAVHHQNPESELSVTIEIPLRGVGNDIKGTTSKFFLEMPSIGDAKALIIRPEPVSSRLVIKSLNEFDLGVWTPKVDLKSFGREFRALLEDIAPRFGSWMNGLRPDGFLNNLFFHYQSGHGGFYTSSFSSLSLNGFRGVPTASNLQGTASGSLMSHQIAVNSSNTSLHFPTFFEQPWFFNDVSGNLQIYVGADYLGIRGKNIKGDRENSLIAGEFSITRPSEKVEQRMSLEFQLSEGGVSDLREFVSLKLPSAARSWLLEAPLSGLFSDIRGAYQGVFQTNRPGVSRRWTLSSVASDLAVKFEEAWPALNSSDGVIEMLGESVVFDFESSEIGGIRISDGTITFDTEALVLGVAGSLEEEANDLLDFIKGSPLSGVFPFIEKDWQAGGGVTIDGQFSMPVGEYSSEKASIDLGLSVINLEVKMPSIGLEFVDLVGDGTFLSPHFLSGSFFGQHFGRPVSLDFRYDPERLYIDAVGSLSAEDVYKLSGLESKNFFHGDLDYRGTLTLHFNDGVSPVLRLDSDLLGLAISVPDNLGKEKIEKENLDLSIKFLEEGRRYDIRYKFVDGYLTVGEGDPKGHLRLNSPASLVLSDPSKVVLTGNLDHFDFLDWNEFLEPYWDQGGGGSFLIEELMIERVQINEFLFEDMIVNGHSLLSEYLLTFKSDRFTGSIKFGDGNQIALDIDRLLLPVYNDYSAVDEPSKKNWLLEDPISLEIGAMLPRMSLSIESVFLGTEDYGSWSFNLEPDFAGIELTSVDGNIRGVSFKDASVKWDYQKNRTSFTNELSIIDLGTVLPLWGFSSGVETSSLAMNVDLSWPGSPLNVELFSTEGEVAIQSGAGRFLDEETSVNGLRLLSIFTPYAIMKRINNFDFSDIIGEGMSFDSLGGATKISYGELEFTQPLIVESRSSTFEFGGKINLIDDSLNNEMIVTLPVSKSLPWYGLYLALANPVAGLGVVIGEQILRKPIEQFSSAKFQIEGTFEDPNVKFQSLWDTEISLPPESSEKE